MFFVYFRSHISSGSGILMYCVIQGFSLKDELELDFTAVWFFFFFLIEDKVNICSKIKLCIVKINNLSWMLIYDFLLFCTVFVRGKKKF